MASVTWTAAAVRDDNLGCLLALYVGGVVTRTYDFGKHIFFGVDLSLVVVACPSLKLNYAYVVRQTQGYLADSQLTGTPLVACQGLVRCGCLR